MTTERKVLVGLKDLKHLLDRAADADDELRATIRARIMDTEAIPEKEYRDFITDAKQIHECEGTLEVDDGAVVSRGDDGAYVQAWVWVPRKEIKLTRTERTELAVRILDGLEGLAAHYSPLPEGGSGICVFGGALAWAFVQLPHNAVPTYGIVRKASREPEVHTLDDVDEALTAIRDAVTAGKET